MANTIDHTKFSRAGTTQEAATEKLTYWWEAKKDQTPASLFAVVEKLDAQQNARALSNARFRRLYGDQDSLSALGYRPSPNVRLTDAANRLARERITFNVIRMAIDTLGSKIAKNRPKSTFVTDDGDWSQKQRAKKTDKWVQGVYHHEKVYAKSRRAFIDSCTEDIGIIWVYSEDGRLIVERGWPAELYVDEDDGRYGSPRSLFRVKAVPREVLLRNVGSNTNLGQAIREAKAPNQTLGGGAPTGVAKVLGDMVQVVEAWHLPSGGDKKDGRHVISVSNTVLLDEPWTRNRFPCAIYRWSERPQGFYGQGAAEQLVGVQVSLNKKLKTINAILHLCSVPRYYVEEASDVVEAQINNQLGAIIKYRGKPPQLASTNAVPPELFMDVERDKARAFELVGLSQLSVASRKPAGLDSGQALRDYNDIETERFALAAQAWEEFHLDIAQCIIDESEYIASQTVKDEKGNDVPKYPDFGISVPTKSGLQRIKWEDVKMDEDKYVLQVFPTSSLPTTPAARIQTLSEWVQSGWIDELEARRLADMPDLDSSNNVAEAARDDVEFELQRLLDGAEYRAPEPETDLVYGVRRFTSAYLRGKREGVPQDVLRNILAWRDAARDMLQQAAAAQPPGGPAGPPAGGPPMPMPPPGAPPMQQ